MNADVRTSPAASSLATIEPPPPEPSTAPGRASRNDRAAEFARRHAPVPPVLAWLAPRLARDAPVPPGTVRLVGIVVHDSTFADPDTSARVSWIGDGSCPHQVMAARAHELDRYDVVVGVSWHEHGPEPVVVLVNP